MNSDMITGAEPELQQWLNDQGIIVATNRMAECIRRLRTLTGLTDPAVPYARVHERAIALSAHGNLAAALVLDRLRESLSSIRGWERAANDSAVLQGIPPVGRPGSRRPAPTPDARHPKEARSPRARPR